MFINRKFIHSLRFNSKVLLIGLLYDIFLSNFPKVCIRENPISVKISVFLCFLCFSAEIKKILPLAIKKIEIQINLKYETFILNINACHFIIICSNRNFSNGPPFTSKRLLICKCPLFER